MSKKFEIKQPSQKKSKMSKPLPGSEDEFFTAPLIPSQEEEFFTAPQDPDEFEDSSKEEEVPNSDKEVEVEEDEDGNASSGEETKTAKEFKRRVKRKQKAKPKKSATMPKVSFPWKMTTPIPALGSNIKIEISERTRTEPWCRMAKRGIPEEDDADNLAKQTFWKLARPPPPPVVGADDDFDVPSWDVDYLPPPPHGFMQKQYGVKLYLGPKRV